MKVLVDGCVWGGAADDLSAAGHDVESTTDWPADPGDDEVLRRAYASGQVLITVDKDFGELAVVHRMPHVGIVRLVDIPARDHGRLAAVAVMRYAEELRRGAIVTVELGRTRVRLREQDDATDDPQK